MSIPALVMSLSWERMPVDMFCWLSLCVCVFVSDWRFNCGQAVCLCECVHELPPVLLHTAGFLSSLISLSSISLYAMAYVCRLHLSDLYMTPLFVLFHCCCGEGYLYFSLPLSLALCPCCIPLEIACLHFSLLVPLDSTTSDSAKSKVSVFFY